MQNENVLKQKQHQVEQLKKQLLKQQEQQHKIKQNDSLYNCINVLHEQNTKLKASLDQAQQQRKLKQRQQMSQLQTAIQYLQKLKAKNIELQQVKSNLRSQIYNQMIRVKLHNNQCQSSQAKMEEYHNDGIGSPPKGIRLVSSTYRNNNNNHGQDLSSYTFQTNQFSINEQNIDNSDKTELVIKKLDFN